MKRIGLLAAALIVALGLWTVADADDLQGGPSEGAGWGMVQGQGAGDGQIRFGAGGRGRLRHALGTVWGRLSTDQRERLRKLRFETQRQVIAKRADVAQARLTLSESMTRYPVDQQAARDAFGKLNRARGEMFQVRLAALAQVQEIVGKELWEEMRASMGPGPMGPGIMGPGTMGPGLMGPGGAR